MAIIFYDHLIDITTIESKLDGMGLKPKKRAKFKSMIDDILHAGLLEFILQKLHPHNHKTFLSQLDHAPYDPELISYLKQHIDDKIEFEIQQESQRLQKLIMKDLRTS